MTSLYDISRSIIRIETLISFCESKGGFYYIGAAKRFTRRLERLKNTRNRLVNDEIKKDLIKR